jgi:hypothetical protein
MTEWPDSGPRDTLHKLGFNSSYVICLSQKRAAYDFEGMGEGGSW